MFKGFRKKTFYNKTKFTTQKTDFRSKLPLKKKLKVARKCFPTPFLSLLDKIWGRTATKLLAQMIFVAAPFELFCRIFGHLATVMMIAVKMQTIA